MFVSLQVFSAVSGIALLAAAIFRVLTFVGFKDLIGVEALVKG